MSTESEDLDSFLNAYQKVRQLEQWGGDDLDLPFHPRRHKNIWAVRRRTFRRFRRLARDVPRGVAVDEGRAVPLPGTFAGSGQDIRLLALGFGRSESTKLAIPYMRRDDA